MERYEFEMTQDVGDAIIAFMDGATVIYHEIQDDRVVPYEMSGEERLTDFNRISDTTFFIYRRKAV